MFPSLPQYVGERGTLRVKKMLCIFFEKGFASLCASVMCLWRTI